MTALVPTSTLLPSQDEAKRYWDLAQRVASTDMVPKTYRGKPDAVLAVAIAGRELGLGPMEALRSFDVIDGKPAPSAQLCHTMALRAGHDIAVIETTKERAVVRCRRAEWPADRYVDIDFTAEDAEDAGLLGKSNWQKYRRAMLRNRAITEAVRAVCPDVLVGATYTPEELGADATDADGRVDDGTWVDHVAEVEVVPTDTTPAPAAAEPEPDTADEDVVDAEVIDDTDQRLTEFREVLATYPGAFIAWLGAEGKLDPACDLAAGSDEGLGKAEARVSELHDWWTARQAADGEEPAW